jgi:hypothetical protein
MRSRERRVGITGIEQRRQPGDSRYHVRDDAQVQPNAATMLARPPLDMPAATVNKTPVPGVATITSIVNKNAGEPREVFL